MKAKTAPRKAMAKLSSRAATTKGKGKASRSPAVKKSSSTAPKKKVVPLNTSSERFSSSSSEIDLSDDQVSVLQELLGRIEEVLLSARRPELWSLERVAEWLDVPTTTAKLYVINREGFPAPFRPTGKKDGQKRWFASEVIEFAKRARLEDGFPHEHERHS